MTRAGVVLSAVLVLFPARPGLTVEIGDKAPNFSAKAIDGKTYSLESASASSDVVVLCFTSSECPIAAAYDERFVEFNKKFQGKGVAFIGLNCNSAPEGLAAMKRHAKKKGFNFIYALDESGKAVKEYGARVTPELFAIKDGKIAYHGAFDNALNDPTQHYLSDAVTALLQGKPPKVAKTKPFGCGIIVRSD